MSVFRRWIICLFIVIVFFAYQLSNFDDNKSRDIIAGKKDLTGLPILDNFEQVRESLLALTKGGKLDKNLTTATEVNSILKKINPKNDWLVSLDYEHIQQVLDHSEGLGFFVSDHHEELGVARFSVVDPDKAMPLLSEMIEQGKVSLNHTLRTPPPPRNYQVRESVEFSDSFLEWLGGSGERNGFGDGVKVALLDSGVKLSHPALTGVKIKHKDLLTHPSAPAISNDQAYAHGTALASLISSQTESFTGIAPGSEILSYRVIDQSGSTDTYTVASAIVTAVQDGADVINLSLGGMNGNEVLNRAVFYALEHEVPLVAAVGNDGIGLVNYPAAYDGVIGVTSVEKTGRVANFANFGDGVDLAAPGVQVLAAWESEGMAYLSGTSVSTALVTGAIAMELARRPDLSNAEIQQLFQNLSNDTHKPGFDSISGHGILSLARLENQNNPNYTDPAITGYYFENFDGLHTGTIPFEIMVQNQGNKWLGDLTLDVNYLDQKKTFIINNLAPGGIRSEKLYLQATDFNKAVEINAKLHVPKGTVDFREENNHRISKIHF